MDRTVHRAIWDVVRPTLRDVGFDSFAAQCAWRRHDQTVDMVVIRSFTGQAASRAGCTTDSFAITCGVFYQCTVGHDVIRTKEYELTFRFRLGKTLRQPWFSPFDGQRQRDWPDIWYVLPDLSNVDECVADAVAAIQSHGLPLVDRFTIPQAAYQALLTETSTAMSFGAAAVEMPGRPDSPRWRDVTLAIGHLVTPDPRSDMWTAPVLANRSQLPHR
jgi:hypothetical protein